MLVGCSVFPCFVRGGHHFFYVTVCHVAVLSAVDILVDLLYISIHAMDTTYRHTIHRRCQCIYMDIMGQLGNQAWQCYKSTQGKYDGGGVFIWVWCFLTHVIFLYTHMYTSLIAHTCTHMLLSISHTYPSVYITHHTYHPSPSPPHTHIHTRPPPIPTLPHTLSTLHHPPPPTHSPTSHTHADVRCCNCGRRYPRCCMAWLGPVGEATGEFSAGPGPVAQGCAKDSK